MNKKIVIAILLLCVALSMGCVDELTPQYRMIEHSEPIYENVYETVTHQDPIYETLYTLTVYDYHFIGKTKTTVENVYDFNKVYSGKDSVGGYKQYIYTISYYEGTKKMVSTVYNGEGHKKINEHEGIIGYNTWTEQVINGQRIVGYKIWTEKVRVD